MTLKIALNIIIYVIKMVIKGYLNNKLNKGEIKELDRAVLILKSIRKK